MKTTMRTLSLVCLCVIFAALAWSHSSFTAAVRGTVTDSSGAAEGGCKRRLRPSQGRENDAKANKRSRTHRYFHALTSQTGPRVAIGKGTNKAPISLLAGLV